MVHAPLREKCIVETKELRSQTQTLSKEDGEEESEEGTQETALLPPTSGAV